MRAYSASSSSSRGLFHGVGLAYEHEIISCPPTIVTRIVAELQCARRSASTASQLHGSSLPAIT